jgi:hypothetical protein
MTQKEIRDQVENLILMSRISKQFAPQEFKTINLVPIMNSYFNVEAMNAIVNKKINSLVVQWNRQVGNNKFEGTEAHSVGNLLNKFRIRSYEDLLVSNYIREHSIVRYYGLTTTFDRVATATLVLVDFINDLASKNLIRGILTPLIALELVDGKFAIVSYIAVDQSNEALVQSMYGSLEFKEGAIPSEFK